MKINRRKKLLLNGVVVGYMAEVSEYHESLKCDLISIKFKGLTGKWQNVATQLDVSVVPDFDSSLEGINLPDGKGWLFDEDKVKRTWEETIGDVPVFGHRTGLGTGHQTKTATGVLLHNPYTWVIIPCKTDDINCFYGAHGVQLWTWDDLMLVDGRSENDKTHA